MKFKSLIFSLFLLAAWHFLTSTKRDPQNPPVGSTGAPSENTCAKTGCHNGGSYLGTVALEGVPDTFAASTTYNLMVKNTSNAVRAGFQLTVLDGADKFTGTLSAATGVSIGTQNSTGRKYARQSAPKNLSGGSTSWAFTWKSPAALVGNKATFYFVSLCANDNDKETGDNVLVAKKTVWLAASVATNEPTAKKLVKIYPTVATVALGIDLEGAEKGRVEIIDLSEKTIIAQNLIAHNSLNINDLAAGTYFARVTAGGRMEVSRFFKI